MSFTGTGGALFVKVLVIYLLSAITFMIYMPWGMCSLAKWYAENTKIGQAPVQFFGTGGSLFVQVLIVALLTMVTFYIYYPWGMVRMLKWHYENMRVGA